MSGSICYHINEKEIAHEIIDGEAIVIHFDSGNYYSLNGIGAKIWEWIVTGASRQQILAAFQATNPEKLATVDQFIDTLVAEALIKPKSPEQMDKVSGPEPASFPFAKPLVEKFNDMQQLLLADPIHEVDEAGWPSTQADARGE